MTAELAQRRILSLGDGRRLAPLAGVFVAPCLALDLDKEEMDSLALDPRRFE